MGRYVLTVARCLLAPLGTPIPRSVEDLVKIDGVYDAVAPWADIGASKTGVHFRRTRLEFLKNEESIPIVEAFHRAELPVTEIIYIMEASLAESSVADLAKIQQGGSFAALWKHYGTSSVGGVYAHNVHVLNEIRDVLPRGEATVYPVKLLIMEPDNSYLFPHVDTPA